MSEEFLDGKSTKLYINDISQADVGEYVCMVGHIMAKFLIGLQGKIWISNDRLYVKISEKFALLTVLLA